MRSGQRQNATTTAATPPAITSRLSTTSGHCSGKTAGRRGAIVRRRCRRQGSTLCSVEQAFGIVLFVVVGVAVVAAVFAVAGTGRLYGQIGRGGLSLDRDDDHRPRGGGGGGGVAERDAEVRQMLEARNARRVQRGQAPVDVEAELARLTAAPAIDPELRAEIRALVVARNARRARQGKPPLDVEDEVRRQIADLGQA